MFDRVFLCCCAFLAIWMPQYASADVTGRNVVILVSELPPDLDMLNTNSIASTTLSQLLLQPLIVPSAETKKGFEHVLTDAVLRDFDDKKFSLRLQSKAAFTSGEPIKILDVTYSLKRCAASLPILGLISIKGRSANFSDSYNEIWIDFQMSGDAVFLEIVKAIGKCPILEYKNSVIFGSMIGKGSNLIGAGEFVLSVLKPGKSYTLSRSGLYPLRSGASTVEISTYKDAQNGLTMLQSGSADAIIINDQTVIETASADSTIETVPCFSHWLLRRKGFTFSCTNDFELRGVGYVS